MCSAGVQCSASVQCSAGVQCALRGVGAPVLDTARTWISFYRPMRLQLLVGCWLLTVACRDSTGDFPLLSISTITQVVSELTVMLVTELACVGGSSISSNHFIDGASKGKKGSCPLADLSHGAFTGLRSGSPTAGGRLQTVG